MSENKLLSNKSVKSQRKLESLLTRRTGDIYRHQRDRSKAAGHWLDYTLEELRRKVRRDLREGRCPYCQGPLTVENFSVDHMVPVARGGTWQMSNVATCCRSCNTVKGALDYVEFKQLLQLVRQWPEQMATNLFARIKAGSRWVKLAQPKRANATPTPKTE